MRESDRKALRAFYQTLGRESFTDEQVALYWCLINGKDARIDFVRKYGDKVGIPPAIVEILASDVTISKEDIAAITAAEVATKVAGKAQGIVDRIIDLIFAPVRWLFGK